MIEAVRELGALILERKGKLPLDVLIENPNPSRLSKKEGTTQYKYPHIITINLDQDLNFSDVALEEFDSSKVNRYLYKSGGGNRSDYSPTSKIVEPDKTFRVKTKSWFNSIFNNSKHSLSTEEDAFLNKIKTTLEENSTPIIESIQNYRNSLPKKEGLILTLKFRDNEGWKYVGEYPVFRHLFEEMIFQEDMEVFSRNKTCSLCKEVKDLVFGSIDTYKFYTLDKPGFICSGLRKEMAWKNFPVCPECKLSLEEGRKFIENNLIFGFYGLNYRLIPKFILGKEKVTDEIIDIFTEAPKLMALKKIERKKVLTGEDDILETLKKGEDFLSLNMLFLKKIQSAERILLHIEDVLPSRLKEIFAKKDEVEKLFDGDIFNMGKIRTFFSKSNADKRTPDLDKYFLEITDGVFRGIPIDLNFLLFFIIKLIRDEFVNDRFFYHRVRDALMVVSFLEKLKLIHFKEVLMEEGIFEELFRKYGSIFEEPVKKGVFLIGTLVELLLNKQYTDRKAKPFMKELKGLKLNEKDIKGLLPKVQNKLEEYDSFDKGKRMIAQEASRYLLISEDNWRLSLDEINFYFASGMNLANQVALIVYKKEV